MPTIVNDELTIVFDGKFYNQEHILWAKFEDGRVVDASEIAEKASSLSNYMVSIRPADKEKRTFLFYRRNEKIGELYFGKPEESYVQMKASDETLYSAMLERVFKTVSASGKYPIVVEVSGGFKNPESITLGILSQEYLKSLEKVVKGRFRRVASIKKIPEALLKDFSMKHSKYGALAITIENGGKTVQKPTYIPPEHDIPLYPELCPIGFTIGFTPNLSEWLTMHYDPIGSYDIGYYVIAENYSLKKVWELKFKEKEGLGKFKLAEVSGKLVIKDWMHIIRSKKVNRKMFLKELLPRSFNTRDESVLSVFYIIPLKHVRTGLTECEVYVYSKYWPSPKLVRLYMKTSIGEPDGSLFWIKHVNLTPSMKWSKVWKHWAKPTRISIITACVLSILKEAK